MTVLVTTLPILAGVLELQRGRGAGRQREQLKADVELLSLLPEKSAVRAKLLEHVEKTVERMIHEDEELKRDPSGIAIALFFIATTVVVIAYAFRTDFWWLWLIAVFVGLIGVAGLADSVVLKRRDEKGRALSSESTDEQGASGITSVDGPHNTGHDNLAPPAPPRSM